MPSCDHPRILSVLLLTAILALLTCNVGATNLPVPQCSAAAHTSYGCPATDKQNNRLNSDASYVGDGITQCYYNTDTSGKTCEYNTPGGNFAEVTSGTDDSYCPASVSPVDGCPSKDDNGNPLYDNGTNAGYLTCNYDAPVICDYDYPGGTLDSTSGQNTARCYSNVNEDGTCPQEDTTNDALTDGSGEMACEYEAYSVCKYDTASGIGQQGNSGDCPSSLTNLSFNRKRLAPAGLSASTNNWTGREARLRGFMNPRARLERAQDSVRSVPQYLERRC